MTKKEITNTDTEAKNSIKDILKYIIVGKKNKEEKKEINVDLENKRKIRVAINGFGRIGRAFLKNSFAQKDFEVVAVNDLGDIHNMAYLLKYDTASGSSNFDVSVKEENEFEKYLIINNLKADTDIESVEKPVLYLSQKEISNLPWDLLEIDIVIESTGLFTTYEKANAHIMSGAKRVIISAPAKNEIAKNKNEKTFEKISGQTVLMGINTDEIKNYNITSNASCTTNAASPVISILDENIGIKKAILNTVHAYTASQSIVDGPNKKDYREGRSAAQNIVPSSTGAAIAVTKVLTNLENKFDGVSLRVPVVSGSIADITFISKRKTSKEEINEILTKASQEERWKNIFSVTNEELVSSDIQGNAFASIVDLNMTRVVDGDLIKVLAWYDNEIGYTSSLILHTQLVAQHLQTQEEN
jgi:glyceraldehyde 3-phosphate dehydrogenase